MKKIYWVNYLFVAILCVPIFYCSQRYLNLPLIYHYLITINIATFIIFGLDKFAAIGKSERVPEIVLYMMSVIGGFFGSFAGMLFFRHKTRKISFYLIPLICFAVYIFILNYFHLLPAIFNNL